MNYLTQAARQALEALEGFLADYQSEDGLNSMKHYAKTHDAAITALRAALEAQQEPVAWRYKPMVGSPWSLSDDGYYISCKRDKGYIVEPLYVHPPAQPQQGWVLVPEEPTPEMVEIGAGVIDDNGGNARWADIREAWAAMLAARPKETT